MPNVRITARRHNRNKPEPMTRRGEVLLSHNHIALLHGLYDRPGGYAESHWDWVLAAASCVERMRGSVYESGIRGAILTMHRSWVEQQRNGRSVSATLTERGRAIVERRVRAWIRGRGAYRGLASVDQVAMASRSAVVPDADIREAVAYASAFGLPLIMRSVQRPGETLYAVSEGLDEPFRIVPAEELEMRGPQLWHWEWTRQVIKEGYAPAAYLEHFSRYDREDVVLYLQQLQDEEADGSLYLELYNGGPILSRAKVGEFLRQEIDLAATDFDRAALVDCIRQHSSGFMKARSAIPSMLAWRHPETRRPVGSVRKVASQGIIENIVATSPAALSCLQRYWDNTNIGLKIETQYSADRSVTDR